MKNRFLLSIPALLFLLNACKKPDACIKASATQAKLGQEVTFTDCSAGGKTSDIDFGDGNDDKDVSGSSTHAYAEPGTFLVKLTRSNKSESKTDEAATTVVVDAPTEAELLGSWQLDKEEVYNMGISVFVPGSNEVWAISSGSFIIDGGSSYSWSLSSNTFTTSYGDGSYTIARLYDDKLILRYNEVDFLGVKTYSAYHFVKI